MMSAYEQRIEKPNSKFQYLLVAAEPYETIGFKVPNIEIDFSEGRYFEAWDKEQKRYTLQLSFVDILNKSAPASGATKANATTTSAAAATVKKP